MEAPRADGRPYFVMELIHGKPLDDYCDSHHLTTPERLELFRQICSALLYAHQHLIVHCDLKPGNILVTDDGTPKLLDFGIAKLLDPDVDSPEATLTMVRMMTPEYASPEQIRGEPINTTTDVYSLGVILYEILTGHRPYRFQTRSPHEVARAILEADPEKPSTVINRIEEVTREDGTKITLTPVWVSIARDGTPEKLRRRLRGDLDNIVLMAIRKDPQRRYPSAGHFLTDVQRHLSGLPVSARQDTVGYRASKFFERHRAAVITASLAIVALIASTIGTAWQAHVAHRERARAERRFTEIRKVANSLLFDVHEAIKDLPGATPARQIIVGKALDFLDGLAKESTGDLALQRELATAYERVGDVQGQARESSLGDTRSALASYRKALALREAVAAADPKDNAIRRELAPNYGRLSDLLWANGDTAGALDYCRKAVRICEQAAAAPDAGRQDRIRLAAGYLDYGYKQGVMNGDHLAGLEDCRKSIGMLAELTRQDKTDRRLRRLESLACSRTAEVLEHNPAARAEALELRRKALEIQTELLALDPNNVDFRRLAAYSTFELADALVDLGDVKAALPYYPRALATFDDLAAADPKNAQYRQDRATVRVHYGIALRKNSEADKAVDQFRKAAAEMTEMSRTTSPERAGEGNSDGGATGAVCRPAAKIALMRLAAGDRLGPYEIVSLLGAGGMGEVYRACDSRIGRDVAIKILHGDVGRFEQEVRAAGALNHPNILSIYDVGTHAGMPYLVSELLDGETLRQRLRSGALEPKAAAGCARDIARGLAAAHRNGIVHRDLKPENIFITRDGCVKILDFGLARRTGPATAVGDSTVTAATTPGAIMGTVGYMSPEQVRGGLADDRSDIFSCGVTLYEMLSGVRAFERDSAVETLNAILKEDAPELPGATPPMMQRIVTRCLEKDPDRRFQSAADLAFALEFADSVETPYSAQVAPPTRRRFLALGGAIAGAAGALLLGTKLARVPRPVFHRLTFRRGSVYAARFAPDGQVIVYDAVWEGGAPRIYTTRAGSSESNALDIPPAQLASVSRSGELAVILQKGNTLARVPLAGGAPREILRNIACADWSPDGQSLLIVRQAGAKQRIEFPAGKVLYQTENSIPEARLSRDGRQVAFFEKSPSPEDHISVNVVDLNGAHRTLVSHWVYGLGIVWAPDGNEIWFSGSDGRDVPPIRAVDMHGKIRTIFGMTTAAAITDALPGGRALFTSISWRAAMMCQAPGAVVERDLSWFDYSLASDIAPDGSTVLFSETRQGAAAAGKPVTYIRKTDGSAAVALGPGHSLGLSPDAQWAAVLVPGSPRQLVIVPTGAGEQRILQSEHFTYFDARWFPDGKRLLVWGNHDERLRRHYVQDSAGGPLRPITSEGAAAEAAIDPAGEYVAAYSGPGVFLYPVDGTEPERVRGDTAGTRPVAWSADGRSLYLRRGNVIELLQLKTGKSEVWKDLMPSDPAGVTLIGRFSMTPDAQSWAYTYERDQSDLYLGEGLL